MSKYIRSDNRHNADKGAHFLQSTRVEKEKEVHKAELKKLHTLRKILRGTKRFEMEEVIYNTVIDYNFKVLQKPNYFDLHGMTVRLALRFARENMKRMNEENHIQTFRLETGVGKNSDKGRSDMKATLLLKYRQHPIFEVTVDSKNPGVLVFEKR